MTRRITVFTEPVAQVPAMGPLTATQPKNTGETHPSRLSTRKHISNTPRSHKVTKHDTKQTFTDFRHCVLRTLNSPPSKTGDG